ncbi:MAG TPA: hypothetical protein VF528_19225 [Pyrinomonadaceae bacterium]|jgi:hypothetical protein
MDKALTSQEVVEEAVEEVVEKHAKDRAWGRIFDVYSIHDHDFDSSPYSITNKQIKEATKGFSSTVEREVRILCKQDTRESRPRIFREKGLFILPTKNGVYSIIKGEGYIDIPPITTPATVYLSQLDFHLDTSEVGNSEMQHLDFAYAASLIRTFLQDESLVLTIRGRKFTPNFSFLVGANRINVSSVQTEVDAGYEGRKQVVLIEAKATGNKNTIIRQLYYPFRQWQSYTKKKVVTVFFEKFGDAFSLWEFQFKDPDNYNSITLTRSNSFFIQEKS